MKLSEVRKRIQDAGGDASAKLTEPDASVETIGELLRDARIEAREQFRALDRREHADEVEQVARGTVLGLFDPSSQRAAARVIYGKSTPPGV